MYYKCACRPDSACSSLLNVVVRQRAHHCASWDALLDLMAFKRSRSSLFSLLEDSPVSVAFGGCSRCWADFWSCADFQRDTFLQAGGFDPIFGRDFQSILGAFSALEAFDAAPALSIVIGFYIILNVRVSNFVELILRNGVLGVALCAIRLCHRSSLMSILYFSRSSIDLEVVDLAA